MSAVTVSTARALPLSVRLRHLREAIAWTPAPRWEGSIAARARFVGYVAASMVLWTIVGVGTTALLGAVLR